MRIAFEIRPERTIMPPLPRVSVAAASFLLSAALLGALGTAGLAATATVPPAAQDGGVSAWTIAWAVGLVSGMVVTTLLKVDWRDLPQLVSIWLRRQRRHAWWAALGAVSLGVLIFV